MLDITELARSSGAVVRPATDADAVDGVMAGAVAQPESTEQVAAVLSGAYRQGLRVVARGAGTALDWGAPPAGVDLLLDTSGLGALVEHSPGDLVCVAETGLPLAELQDTLAQSGQELSLDAPVQRLRGGATIGGLLATAASGPRRLQRLALRDLVLGATVVLADGTVAASGGKVVKNVAGYDLAKLMTGSFGTLGIVVRCAFRLHPIAPARRYITLEATSQQAAHAAGVVLDSQSVPSAVELNRWPGAETTTLAVLLEGSEPAVTRRAEDVAALIGGELDEQPAWWGSLPQAPVLAKATATISGVGDLLGAAERAEQQTGTGVAMRGSALGLLHAGLSHGQGDVAGAIDMLRSAARDAGDGSVTVLVAPRDLRERIDAWGPVPGLGLMRQVKERFDPGRRLAPGRFVGGI